MAWWNRKRKETHTYRPPPPPPREKVREVEERLEEAETTLADISSMDEEVRKRAEYLSHLERTNHLGPKFWDAMGLQRRKAT